MNKRKVQSSHMLAYKKKYLEQQPEHISENFRGIRSKILKNMPMSNSLLLQPPKAVSIDEYKPKQPPEAFDIDECEMLEQSEPDDKDKCEMLEQSQPNNKDKCEMLEQSQPNNKDKQFNPQYFANTGFPRNNGFLTNNNSQQSNYPTYGYHNPNSQQFNSNSQFMSSQSILPLQTYWHHNSNSQQFNYNSQLMSSQSKLPLQTYRNDNPNSKQFNNNSQFMSSQSIPPLQTYRHDNPNSQQTNDQQFNNSNINPKQTIDPSNELKRKISEKSKNKLDLLLKACKESELSDQSNMDIIKEKTKV
jgi:hypothetical protein